MLKPRWRPSTEMSEVDEAAHAAYPLGNQDAERAAFVAGAAWIVNRLEWLQQKLQDGSEVSPSITSDEGGDHE